MTGVVMLSTPEVPNTGVAGPLTPIGIVVNVLWAVYDLVVLSVIVRAALYRAPEKASPAVAGGEEG